MAASASFISSAVTAKRSVRPASLKWPIANLVRYPAFPPTLVLLSYSTWKAPFSNVATFLSLSLLSTIFPGLPAMLVSFVPIVLTVGNLVGCCQLEPKLGSCAVYRLIEITPCFSPHHPYGGGCFFRCHSP